MSRKSGITEAALTHSPVVKSLFPENVVHKINITNKKQHDKEEDFLLSSVLLKERKEREREREREREKER